MDYNLHIDENRLFIFHELKKRKIYVGELIYDPEQDVYKLIYDEDYRKSKSAISIGPDLDLFKTEHTSSKGQLFPIFWDRIPLKSNPAYEDYCSQQNISAYENNPIILLGSIGKRGPSSFVFEPAYKTNFSINSVIKMRQDLKISQHDFALALDLKKVTLQRLEKGVSNDANIIKLLEIYFKFPDVAIWQLIQRKMWIHHTVFTTMVKYFADKQIIQ